MVDIEVDEEVFSYLKARAEPFVDTPNTVLRRELGLASSPARSKKSSRNPAELSAERSRRRGRVTSRAKPRGKRAPAGSILPESEYVDPILRVIADKGGRAPTREVIEGVGAIVYDRLTDLDRETMSSGAIRWHNRIQFTRLRMVDQGLLKRDSPRGVWEISDEGRRRIASETAA